MEVSRSGSTGMDAGRAVLGHGWPVTACPRSGTGARELERSESRTQGQGLFAYFCGCLAKVSRRKGGTRRKTSYIEWICTLAIWKLRVHIHYMCLAELKVSLLQRGTFGKQPQKYPKGPCPTIRPSSPRLARCLLSGAVMGARRDGPSLARSRLARRPASPPP